MSFNFTRINNKILYILYILFSCQIALFIIKKFNNYDNNILALWAAIILCVFIILLEIVSNCHYLLIAFQIIFFSFLLHLLFVPPIGLYDSDPLYEFRFIEQISKYGWSMNLNSELSPWPFIHIYIYAASILIGISLVDASRYLPSLISVLSLLFVFCLAKLFFRNVISSNLAILLFSITYMYIMFYSQPVRETAAFLILFLALYCYVIGIDKNDIRLIFLSEFSGLMLIIVHHFTALIYIVFLIIYYLYWTFISHFMDFSLPSKNKITYGLLILIASLSYWIYASISVFSTLAITTDKFFKFGEDHMTPFAHMMVYPNLMNFQTELYTLSMRLTFITAMILIISVYKKDLYTRDKLCNYLILLFVSCLSITWLFGTTGLMNIVIYPERLLNFAWVFLLIFMGKRLYDIFIINQFSWEKVISICFLLAFITMNISLIVINSYLYDPSVEPPYVNGAISLMHLPQEYAAFTWFNGLNLGGVIQCDRITEDFLNHNDRKIRTDLDLFMGNLSAVRNSNWLVIRKEMFKRIIGTKKDNYAIKKPLNLTKSAYNDIINNNNIRKIYDNEKVSIFNIDSSNNIKIQNPY